MKEEEKEGCEEPFLDVGRRIGIPLPSVVKTDFAEIPIARLTDECGEQMEAYPPQTPWQFIDSHSGTRVPRSWRPRHGRVFDLFARPWRRAKGEDGKSVAPELNH